MTHQSRRLITSLCITCLLLLAHAPVSFGQKLKPADVSSLVRDLKADGAKLRLTAASRLLSANAEVPAAVSVLLNLVEHGDKDIRKQVFDVIEEIGPEARDAIPVLAEALRSDAFIVRYAALKALGAIGSDKSNVAELAKELKDNNPGVRALAAGRLAAMGEDAEAAGPTLIEMLKDPDRATRRLAAYVLGEIRVKAPVTTLLALLKDEDTDTRTSAMSLLGNIGPDARDAVPALIEFLNGDDKDFRRRAASALGEIGPDSKPAIPILLKMLRDPERDARASAAYALRKLDLEASAVPVLVEALSDDDSQVRMYAAEIVRKLGPAARDAVPHLVSILKAPDFFSRFEAANALRAIGPEAKDAVPALLKSLNDRHAFVRTMVAVALIKIDPASESQIKPELLKQARDQIEHVEKKGGRYGIGFMPAPEPKSKEAASHYWRGEDFYKQGDLDAAIASFSKAIQIDPRYTDAYHRRGLVRRAKGDNDSAVDDFTRAINTATEDLDTYYHARGFTHLARGKYDAAIADLNKTISLNPYNAEAYLVRGLAHYRKGNSDAAIADYDRALEFIPPMIEAYAPRGVAKFHQGKTADAIADFSEAVKFQPQNYANYERLGDAYSRLGDMERARDAWGKALAYSTVAEHSARIQRKLNGAEKP